MSSIFLIFSHNSSSELSWIYHKNQEYHKWGQEYLFSREYEWSPIFFHIRSLHELWQVVFVATLLSSFEGQAHF